MNKIVFTKVCYGAWDYDGILMLTHDANNAQITPLPGTKEGKG